MVVVVIVVVVVVGVGGGGVVVVVVVAVVVVVVVLVVVRRFFASRSCVGAIMLTVATLTSSVTFAALTGFPVSFRLFPRSGLPCRRLVLVGADDWPTAVLGCLKPITRAGAAEPAT